MTSGSGRTWLSAISKCAPCITSGSNVKERWFKCLWMCLDETFPSRHPPIWNEVICDSMFTPRFFEPHRDYKWGLRLFQLSLICTFISNHSPFARCSRLDSVKTGKNVFLFCLSDCGLHFPVDVNLRSICLCLRDCGLQFPAPIPHFEGLSRTLICIYFEASCLPQGLRSYCTFCLHWTRLPLTASFSYLRDILFYFSVYIGGMTGTTLGGRHF